MYWNKRCKTFCIVINNVLSIVINIQYTIIFEPVILTGFYTSLYIKYLNSILDTGSKYILRNLKIIKLTGIAIATVYVNYVTIFLCSRNFRNNLTQVIC